MHLITKVINHLDRATADLQPLVVNILVVKMEKIMECNKYLNIVIIFRQMTLHHDTSSQLFDLPG